MHWVEVRHRVPESGNLLLLWSRLDGYAVGWYKHNDGKGWWGDDCDVQHHTTHWMALEPPEASGGD